MSVGRMENSYFKPLWPLNVQFFFMQIEQTYFG